MKRGWVSEFHSFLKKDNPDTALKLFVSKEFSDLLDFFKIQMYWKEGTYMKSATILGVMFFACIVISCSSFRTLLLEDKLMTAELRKFKSDNTGRIDSSWAVGFDTVWRDDQPQRIAGHYWYASILNFTFHLAYDDSVIIYYTNAFGRRVFGPLRVYLSKGSYTFHPTRFDFQTGVYEVVCIFDRTKWTKKVSILN